MMLGCSEFEVSRFDLKANDCRDAAELEAAAQDPLAMRRVLHSQYLRQLASCEASCREHKVWEDVCFVCKRAGEHLQACQWGLGSAETGGDGNANATANTACWKAYHPTCLTPPMVRTFKTVIIAVTRMLCPSGLRCGYKGME